jgi:hypothetical protein
MLPLPPSALGSAQPRPRTVALTPHKPFGRQQPGSVTVIVIDGQLESGVPGVVVTQALPAALTTPPQAFASPIGQHAGSVPNGVLGMGLHVLLPHVTVVGASLPPSVVPPAAPAFPAPPSAVPPAVPPVPLLPPVDPPVPPLPAVPDPAEPPDPPLPAVPVVEVSSPPHPTPTMPPRSRAAVSTA